MRRKIYDTLLKWKLDENGAVALLIEGARRVGKSYIVEEFGKREYKSYILIDFNKVGKDVKDLFRNYLEDLDTFFAMLSARYGKRLYPRETLFIFDEVQRFPAARAAIKYLVQDGRYDYIETGSLLSIKMNTEDIEIPSEERSVPMHPMDFEEFLWALGNDQLMPLIQSCFEKKQPMGPLHRKAMDYFRQYLIVGGMPQAVAEYVQTRDFERVDRRKRDILALYRKDITKFAKGYEAKVSRIFDEVPSQLQRHEKKFKLADLNKGARMRDYESAFFWLQEAKIVNICYNSTQPNIGLKLNEDNTVLKCYMGDTGLLISHAFAARGTVTKEIYRKILFDKLEFNGGMIVENVVAQMLTAAGHELFFFTNADREDKENRMEIDFLIQKPTVTSRHNISPIEVKSSTKYTLTSIERCIKKYSSFLSTPYVLHSKDVEIKDGLTFLPLYMTSLL